MLTSDLECKAGWDLVDLTGGSDLGSRDRILGDYGYLGEGCSPVSESLPSSVAYLLSLTTPGLKANRGASILE